MYWKPRKVSRTAVVAAAVTALASVVCVEHFQRSVEQPWGEEKLAAAQTAARAMRLVKAERLRLGHAIEAEYDPAATGLIGAQMTPITSVAGGLFAKQTSANPNFAAVVVEMLRDAGVQPGDTVAIGYSGSYPALNIASLAAVETMGLQPIVIASAASSQFGANLPDLMWVDMERLLVDKGCLNSRAVAASLGGYGDLGLGMAAEARELLADGIRRNGLPVLTAESLPDAIDKRMDIYDREAHGRPIRAYLNVGGGTISVGQSIGKKMFRPGLNTKAPAGTGRIDGMLSRFIERGVPVIHLVHATALAARYGLPRALATTPAVGEGDVYIRHEYNPWLAGLALLATLAVLLLAATDFRGLTSEGDLAVSEESEEDPGPQLWQQGA
jgi:poly-gamma-glutamate system protein